MSAQEQQTAADPYAELKAAWEAGKTLIITHCGATTTANKTKGQFVYWVFPPECYEVAPDPTPAGKMSDKELAEIYQNTTASSHVGHSVYKWDELSQDHQEARIQGIRAVREQVEKERAEEIARLTAELAAAEKRLAELQMRPAALPPATTEEEVERADFENTFPNMPKDRTPSGMYANDKFQAMWESWQAARALKEVQR